MKRSTPLTTSVEQQREWEQRTREKTMARRRESSREGRAPFARRRAALPRRGRNFARNRRERFGEKSKWIVGLRCLVCGWLPSEPHHEPPVGRGGKAEALTPLCGDHHRLHPASRHRLGSAERFFEVHKIDLVYEASRLEEEWAA